MGGNGKENGNATSCTKFWQLYTCNLKSLPTLQIRYCCLLFGLSRHIFLLRNAIPKGRYDVGGSRISTAKIILEMHF